MSETVALDCELRSPIGRVWHALIDAEMLSKWTFFDAENFQPVVGHRFRFRGKPDFGGVVVECEVLEVDEPHRLAYTWALQAALHQTTVAWTLTETDGGGTRLHLEQSGFASDAKQELGGAKYGWTHMLNQLQGLLASD